MDIVWTRTFTSCPISRVQDRPAAAVFIDHGRLVIDYQRQLLMTNDGLAVDLLTVRHPTHVPPVPDTLFLFLYLNTPTSHANKFFNALVTENRVTANLPS